MQPLFCFFFNSSLQSVCPVPRRRPSQWLAPGVSALTRMVSSSSAPIIRRFPGTLEEAELESDNEDDDDGVERKDTARPLRLLMGINEFVF